MAHPPAVDALPLSLLKQVAELKRLQAESRNEQLLEKVASLRETFPEAAPYLMEFEAFAFQGMGQANRAAESFRQALSAFEKPPPSVFVNLHEALHEAGRPEEAEELLQEALLLYPAEPSLLALKLQNLHGAGCLSAAIALARDVCRVHDQGACWNSYAEIAFDLGLYQEGMAAFRHCWQLAPQLRLVWHNSLFMAHYVPEHSKDDLLALHREWYVAACGDLPATPPALLERRLDPHNKLRIGIFSAGLQKHPAGWMTSRPLQHLARLPDYEFFFYNTNDTIPEGDEARAMFRGMAASWHDAGRWSDERLYE